MKHIAKQILCNVISCFRDGSHQFEKYGCGPKPEQIIVFSFGLDQDYQTESGDHFIDLIAWIRSNYIFIMCRESWSLIKKGGKVDQGNGKLEVLANHDECWREGVEVFLRAFDGALVCINYDFLGTFYKVKNINEEDVQEIEEAISRYKRNQRNWKSGEKSFEEKTRERFENLKELRRLREEDVL
jgi:hypothetical protein